MNPYNTRYKNTNLKGSYSKYFKKVSSPIVKKKAAKKAKKGHKKILNKKPSKKEINQFIEELRFSSLRGMFARTRKSPHRLIRIVISEDLATFLKTRYGIGGRLDFNKAFYNYLKISRMFFNKKDFVEIAQRSFKIRICKRRDLRFFNLHRKNLLEKKISLGYYFCASYNIDKKVL
jgi:hypothetical protein